MQAKFDPMAVANAILADASILSGDEVGPSGSAWQDVAGTLAANLSVLSTWFAKVRTGEYRADMGEVAQVAAALNGNL